MLADVHCWIEVVRFGSKRRAFLSVHCRIFPGFVMNGRTSIGDPFQ
jgi:hypothetical protein